MKDFKHIYLAVVFSGLTGTIIQAQGTQSLPSWQAPLGNRYSAMIYARVLDATGNALTNAGSLLAVFEGTNCAGVASLSSGPNGSLFQLPVYSDQTPVAGLTYQIYNAESGQIFAATESYSFQSGSLSGSIVNPIALHESYLQPVPLWSNGFGYSVNSNSATILGYSGTNSEVTIPSTLGGTPVTSIGSYAFENQPTISSLIIPSGVSVIGNSAFAGDSNLLSVSIPDSVMTFGTNLFENSPNVIVNGSQNMIAYLSQNAATLGISSNALTSIQDGGVASLSYDLIETWLLADTNFLSGLENEFSSNGFALGLASNTALVTSIASNSVFLNALVNSITNTASSYGILRQGPQGPAGAVGATGPQGPVGVFDPSVLTNTVFLSGLASNQAFGTAFATNLFFQTDLLSSSTFLLALSNQIALYSNNLGIATKADLSSNSSQISGLSNSFSSQLSNAVATLNSENATLSNGLSGQISSNVATFSTALSNAYGLLNGVSNSLNGTINSNTVILSNALTGVIAAQGVSFSNALSTALNNIASNQAVQTAALSNALSVVVANLSAQTSPTNPAFIAAIAQQILSATNNDGLPVKQNQSLNFPAIPAQTYKINKTVKLSVTSSANLPVIYSVANTAIATVSNNVLTLKGRGTTTVTATSTGNALYSPVTATQTLIVK